MTRVFVYGTLLRGEKNHDLLMGSPFLGMARTEPLFSLFNLGGFPAMCRHGCTSVVGEVYEVSQEVLETIDELEGHPNWYRRTPISLSEGMVAETYLLEPDQVEGGVLISSGNWRLESKGKRR